MNKDQVKGATKNAVGKLQKTGGKAVGSRRQQAKGLGKEVVGKTQERIGDAKEALKTNRKKAAR